jgi:hypothetical protein
MYKLIFVFRQAVSLKQVKDRCRKGIPPGVRAKAWQYLCGGDFQMKHNEGKYEVNAVCLSKHLDGYVALNHFWHKIIMHVFFLSFLCVCLCVCVCVCFACFWLHKSFNENNDKNVDPFFLYRNTCVRPVTPNTWTILPKIFIASSPTMRCSWPKEAMGMQKMQFIWFLLMLRIVAVTYKVWTYAHRWWG